MLDRLDLGQHRRVLDVVLHFPQARVGLGALGGRDLQVLLPAPEILAGRVGLGPERVERLLGLGEGGVDGVDLFRQAGGFGLERGDARIEGLQIYQRQELRVHATSDFMLNSAVGCPQIGATRPERSGCPQIGATRAERSGCPQIGATRASIRPLSVQAGLEAPATVVGPPGLEPRPNRL